MSDPPVELWPQRFKLPGVAHSWEGAAWVRLQRPHALDEGRLRGAIARRLEERLAPDRKGYTSLFIGSGGRTLVAALAARNDEYFRKRLPRQIRFWCDTVERSPLTDVMLGAAGALLAAAEIETLVPGQLTSTAVRGMCKQVEATARAEMKRLARNEGVCLGLAHGVAGYLLALEAVQNVFGFGLQRPLRAQLIDALARTGIDGPWKTTVWPNFVGDDLPHIQGWCHGGPGVALALVAGFAMTGDLSYKQLADRALEGTARFPSVPRTFCCGTVGKAHILIEAYRLTRKRAWLEKAVLVTKEGHLVSESGHAYRGLHMGRLGPGYLEQRFSNPMLPMPGLGPLSVMS